MCRLCYSEPGRTGAAAGEGKRHGQVLVGLCCTTGCGLQALAGRCRLVGVNSFQDAVVNVMKKEMCRTG